MLSLTIFPSGYVVTGGVITGLFGCLSTGVVVTEAVLSTCAILG